MKQWQQTRPSYGNQSLGTRPWRRLVTLTAAAGAVVAILLLAGQTLRRAEAADEPAAGATPSPSDRPPEAEPPAADATKAAPKPECKTSCRRRCRARCRVRPGGRFRHRRHRCCAQPGQENANPNPHAWKDLFDGKTLTGWKVPNFGGQGEVRVKDGMVVMEMGNDMTGIVYTGEVPETDYEIELEGSRLDGIDFFCTTTFRVGKEPCTLVVGGWGGTVVGLSNVDYYDASDNLTTSFHEFKNKQWYKVRIRVTEPKVEAWIDDEQVVNQKRKGHKFGIRIEVDLCQPLGISAWCTTGAVRNIRMRRLKSTAEVPQPAEK